MYGADRSFGEQTGSGRKQCSRSPGELEESDKMNGKVFVACFFFPLSSFRMLCLQLLDIAVLHICVSIVSKLSLIVSPWFMAHPSARKLSFTVTKYET